MLWYTAKGNDRIDTSYLFYATFTKVF